ncbi:MAG: triose-phosphate isomerase [Trueperaceae bacterium]|nr:triose-phosphate isomerase [Trueperaceae bacterium]
MSRPQPLIAGNWKMNRLPSEAVSWTRELLARLDRAPVEAGELALIVPYTHLPAMTSLAFGTQVALGAQDVSAHEEGAYTGEVSAAMLADLGTRYVVVGHSERRAYHGEDDALVNAKAARVMAHGMVPIVCVGEQRAERDAGRAEEVVLGQVERALQGLAPADPAALVVAYEPVWAIGTGLTATAADAAAMGAAIRRLLRRLLPTVADGVRLLYGGSMKPGNAAELLAQPDVNGGLIGGASLQLDDYLAIAAAA